MTSTSDNVPTTVGVITVVAGMNVEETTQIKAWVCGYAGRPITYVHTLWPILSMGRWGGQKRTTPVGNNTNCQHIVIYLYVEPLVYDLIAICW